MKTKYLLFIYFAVITTINVLAYIYERSESVEPLHNYIQQIDPPVDPVEVKPNITTEIPIGELSLDQINSTLDQWHKEAPAITEVGIVGVDHTNKPIKYIRIGKKNGPKVLIMAAIHGNEKLCAMTSLGVFNEILKNYMTDESVTALLQTRDIYYIPIICPEGYVKNSRHVLNLDPNRNFNGPNLKDKKSIPEIQALKDFYEIHQFKAVMSCHNFGRVVFYPWGYTTKKTPLESQYRTLLEKMKTTSGYGYVQLYRQSAPPYHGYEVDYFFNKGALSIVNEIGRNFKAEKEEISTEVKNNYKSFLTFIEEAPLIR